MELKGVIEGRLEQLMRELTPGELEITPETDLRSLGIDSLDLSEIAQAMIDEFGAEVPTQTLERVQTVGDVVEVIVAHAD